MKHKLVSLVFLLALTLSAKAELRTTVYSGGSIEFIDVPNGTTIEIISLQQEFTSEPASPSEIIITPLPDGPTPFHEFKVGEFSAEAPFRNAIFAGPIRLEISLNNRQVLMTYRLTNTESGLSAAGPSNTVVIPEDASGSVSIILESSTDLVTRTGALPGNYGSSTSKRFFRLRATKN